MVSINKQHVPAFSMMEDGSILSLMRTGASFLVIKTQLRSLSNPCKLATTSTCIGLPRTMCVYIKLITTLTLWAMRLFGGSEITTSISLMFGSIPNLPMPDRACSILLNIISSNITILKLCKLLNGLSTMKCGKPSVANFTSMLQTTFATTMLIGAGTVSNDSSVFIYFRIPKISF